MNPNFQGKVSKEAFGKGKLNLICDLHPRTFVLKIFKKKRPCLGRTVIVFKSKYFLKVLDVSNFEVKEMLPIAKHSLD